VFSIVPARLNRDRRTDDGAFARRDANATRLYLDRVLPDAHAVVRRHRVVDATPDTAYDAALAADLTRLGPVVAALGALRAAPTRVGSWLRGTPAPATESFTFGDIPTRGTWVRLADVAGEEFVFGAVGTVWRPDIEWVDLAAAGFRRFDRPGYAKVAAGLSFRPYGDARTLVTDEARTTATDAAVERRFGRYWLVVRPFVGYVLGRVLARIAADVEKDRRSTW
jgi:hypothetical protein